MPVLGAPWAPAADCSLRRCTQGLHSAEELPAEVSTEGAHAWVHMNCTLMARPHSTSIEFGSSLGLIAEMASRMYARTFCISFALKRSTW